MQYILGVDFDNTLVSYDELMHKRALSLGLISADAPKNKKMIRDTIRLLPDGENEWQRLQAFAYGKGIDGAEMFEGVREFFHACRAAGITVFIISHKTEFARLDKEKTNLRDTALAWMAKNEFFEKDGMGMSPDRVFFEPTIEAKIAKVKELACTHFIDDLEEIFLHETFPKAIHKILFVQSGSNALKASTNCQILGSWKEISEYFGTDRDTGLFANEKDVVEALLKEPVTSSEKTGTGSNSRVHRVETLSGKQFAAKFYFHKANASRDRLDAEYSGLSYLWENGMQCIPRPIAVNREARCAIYQYIEGTKFAPDGVKAEDIDQVVRFLGQLKAIASRSAKDIFYPAAEAFFSVRKIIENIEWRMDRLQKEAQDEQLHVFLSGELSPFLAVLLNWCSEKAKEYGIVLDEDISAEARTLSPSDVGFHNALKNSDGRIIFLDFEYFGWDDPAKMISDILLHPAMAFGEFLKKRFATGVFDAFAKDRDLIRRVEIVYPLFGFKWCLIFLNEFIPDELKRRNFAQGNWNAKEDLLSEQLGKARNMLKYIKDV